jgi:predicted O-methyltransferase YrrM
MSDTKAIAVAKRQLARFLSITDPVLAVVQDSLRATLLGRLTDDERRLTSGIENLRTGLRSRDEIIDTSFARQRHSAGGTDRSTRRRPPASSRRSVAEMTGSSLSQFWALLLFALIRRLKPSCCLELGTCVGISAAYQAAALTLNGHGRLATLEGAVDLAEVSRQNLGHLGFGNVDVVLGTFDRTVHDTAQRMTPIDFALIDGSHQEDPAVRYFNSLAAHAAERSLIVLDDVALSSGMKRAWTTVRHHPDVIRSLDLGKFGVCLLHRGGRQTGFVDLSCLPFVADDRAAREDAARWLRCAGLA